MDLPFPAREVPVREYNTKSAVCPSVLQVTLELPSVRSNFVDNFLTFHDLAETGIYGESLTKSR